MSVLKTCHFRNIALCIICTLSVIRGMAFTIEDRVKCTANLNVRATPSTSGTILTTETAGARGIIIDGPQAANGFTWWKITWDNGYIGWSAESFLTLVTTYSLNIASSNPNSGVYVYVGPNDILKRADGTTPFNRVFDASTVVTLIAPTTAGGNNFVKWTRNGVDYDLNRTTTVTMSANYTMTAIFALPPPVTHVITVASFATRLLDVATFVLCDELIYPFGITRLKRFVVEASLRTGLFLAIRRAFLFALPVGGCF